MLFQRSVGEFVAFDKLRRMEKGSIKTAKEIMHLDSLGFIDPKNRERRLGMGYQVATFFRFIEGPGKGHELLKGRDFLMQYMKEVLAIAKRYDKREGIRLGSVAEATTEEEEEEQAAESSERQRAYQKAAAARRAEFLAELYKRTCKWSDEEWSSLDRAYIGYHQKKTR